ncbi:MAG TPA: hypothetical protein VM409_06075, partial [Chloroflexia bacterium]|nr:hypothetical protein [Chloroflexia bacterium]
MTASKTALARLAPQPLVGFAVILLALGTLMACWFIEGAGDLQTSDLLVALALGCAVVATYQFPIHLGRGQKVEMTSAALVLTAVLVPDVTVASGAAGLSVLAGEMLVRRQRGNFLSDVATAAG